MNKINFDKEGNPLRECQQSPVLSKLTISQWIKKQAKGSYSLIRNRIIISFVIVLCRVGLLLVS